MKNTDELRAELENLRERYHDLVPALDDAHERLESAEASEGETRREARTRHALGELTDAELAVEEKAITKRLDDLRGEAERLEDAAEGVGRRVEETGERLAEAMRAQAAAAVDVVNELLRPLLAQVQTLEAVRAARLADADEADRQARQVEDESRVRPSSRKLVEERQRYDEQIAKWYERHPDAGKNGPDYLRVR